MKEDKETVVPEFDWARIGDVASGREHLGELLPVAVYRLMQFTVFDVMEARCGKDAAQSMFRQAGFLAGMAFAKNNLDLSADFNAFVAQLQNVLKQLMIGILKIETANTDKTKLTLSVSEDLDCSGLPDVGETICYYDEGFLAGVLKAYTGGDYDVVEVDCWAAGGRTCRFTAERK